MRRVTLDSYKKDKYYPRIVRAVTAILKGGDVVVPIGAHRVVFRHPELGEQAHNTTLTPPAPARVSADMRKR